MQNLFSSQFKKLGYVFILGNLTALAAFLLLYHPKKFGESDLKGLEFSFTFFHNKILSVNIVRHFLALF